MTLFKRISHVFEGAKIMNYSDLQKDREEKDIKNANRFKPIRIYEIC